MERIRCVTSELSVGHVRVHIMDSGLVIAAFVTGVVLGGAVISVLLWRRVNEWQQRAYTAEAQVGELRHVRDQSAEAEAHQDALMDILQPMHHGLQDMRRAVAQVERDYTAQYSRVSQQLTHAAQADAEILKSTQALLGSLHSTTARGYWGEVQLRRVVEAAGMLPHVDFSEQVSSADRGRPDMVVHLPGGRHLVVDAKAPLHPTDPVAQARALKSRVAELSRKEYWAATTHSPEMVFCFVAAESLLSAAVREDPQLLEHSMAKGVALTSPASLLASLKAVESAWRQESIAANVQEVIRHSTELYRRLETMGGHLQDTGRRISQAADSYNKLLGNIEKRVMPQVQALSQLSVHSGLPEQSSEAGAHGSQTADIGAGSGNSTESDTDSAVWQSHDSPLAARPISTHIRDIGPRLHTDGTSREAQDS